MGFFNSKRTRRPRHVHAGGGVLAALGGPLPHLRPVRRRPPAPPPPAVPAGYGRLGSGGRGRRRRRVASTDFSGVLLRARDERTTSVAARGSRHPRLPHRSREHLRRESHVRRRRRHPALVEGHNASRRATHLPGLADGRARGSAPRTPRSRLRPRVASRAQGERFGASRVAPPTRAPPPGRHATASSPRVSAPTQRRASAERTRAASFDAGPTDEAPCHILEVETEAA